MYFPALPTPDLYRKEVFYKPLFGRLIHSRWLEKQRPALGQYSIGRVGQYSIGANNHLHNQDDKYWLDGHNEPASVTFVRDFHLWFVLKKK